MSTFTIRDNVARCDHCGLRVGKGWRDKADHECPTGFRTVIAPLPAKTCEHIPCGEPLDQRDDETPWAFGRRRFCDRSCSRRASIARKRAAA